MRTALLAWDYPPAPSGLSVAAREIAESLAALGHAVTVFTMDREGVSERGGVQIHGCPPQGGLARLRLFGAAGHLAAPLAFRRALLAEHARRPFAVVEATNWYAPAALLAGPRSPVPLVTRNSTPAAFSRDPARTLRDRLDALAADRLERRQARGSAGLISNTAAHAERMHETYGLDPAQPHAVIGLSLSPEMLGRAKDASYPAAEPIRLLFVGRAEHRKGFDAILDAAALLGAEPGLPPFAIGLAGVEESALPGDLAPAARRVLHPLGRLAPDALAQAYEAAHAVLAPSRYESFGLVYQEALAYGRPVIASMDDRSARAFVGETGAGSMAVTTSGTALAEAIRPVLRDAALRGVLREKALAAAGRFTRRSLGEETIALYEKAIERRQARKG